MEDENPTFPSSNFRTLNLKDGLAFLKIDKCLQIFYKYQFNNPIFDRIMRPLLGEGALQYSGGWNLGKKGKIILLSFIPNLPLNKSVNFKTQPS